MFTMQANEDWARIVEAGVYTDELPLNEHRNDNQQRKKDREQNRGHQPLSNLELGDI